PGAQIRGETSALESSAKLLYPWRLGMPATSLAGRGTDTFSAGLGSLLLLGGRRAGRDPAEKVSVTMPRLGTHRGMTRGAVWVMLVAHLAPEETVSVLGASSPSVSVVRTSLRTLDCRSPS